MTKYKLVNVVYTGNNMKHTNTLSWGKFYARRLRRFLTFGGKVDQSFYHRLSDQAMG